PMPPVTVQKPLTIRAAQGSRPVLMGVGPGSFIQTDQPLTVEGLTFRWNAEEAGKAVIATTGQRLAVANCRFEVNFDRPIMGHAISADRTTTAVEVRNCLFLAGSAEHLLWQCPPAGSFTVEENGFA